MKKLLFVVLLLIVCCLLTGYSAFAEELPCFVRVTEDDVMLYADANANKQMFVLQKSYYAQVLAEENDKYLVTVMPNTANFPKICGYVVKNEVLPCNETPLAPYYPTTKITVNENSATLKLSPSPNAQTVVIATNMQTLSYFGTINSYGKTWYYVYYCGNFGYVDSTQVFLPTVAMHPTPLPIATPVVEPVTQPTEPPEVTPTEPDLEKPSGMAEIALIAFVCLLAGALVLALFLPSKKQNV